LVAVAVVIIVPAFKQTDQMVVRAAVRVRAVPGNLVPVGVGLDILHLLNKEIQAETIMRKMVQELLREVAAQAEQMHLTPRVQA